MDELLVAGRQQLEYAELTRFSCRDNYEALQSYAKEVTHQLQVMLSGVSTM